MIPSVQQTSLLAYNEVLPKLRRRQEEVLNVFLADPLQYPDYTNMEVADVLGWSINRVTPRVLELRDLGVLEYACTRLCTVTGYTAMAWRRKR